MERPPAGRAVVSGSELKDSNPYRPVRSRSRRIRSGPTASASGSNKMARSPAAVAPRAGRSAGHRRRTGLRPVGARPRPAGRRRIQGAGFRQPTSELMTTRHGPGPAPERRPPGRASGRQSWSQSPRSGGGPPIRARRPQPRGELSTRPATGTSPTGRRSTHRRLHWRERRRRWPATAPVRAPRPSASRPRGRALLPGERLPEARRTSLLGNVRPMAGRRVRRRCGLTGSWGR